MKTSRGLVLIISILLAFGCYAESRILKSKELSLVKEIKLNVLLRNKNNEDKHEASGVEFANNRFYVVFDNYAQVAQIDIGLKKAELLGKNEQDTEYEGIAYFDDKFYLIEESIDNEGAWNARLNIANTKFEIDQQKWLKYNFQSDNKGFEGIAVLKNDKKEYILALCEGNDCEANGISKVYGAGRIKVFESDKKNDEWEYIASIRLPQSLQFKDYSGIAINKDNMMAITSQESSAIWITKLDPGTWTIGVPGTIHEFPKDKNGNVVYCNIEGVDWLTENQVVTVSDARKDDQHERCKEKEQAIHIMSM